MSEDLRVLCLHLVSLSFRCGITLAFLFVLISRARIIRCINVTFRRFVLFSVTLALLFREESCQLEVQNLFKGFKQW